MEIKNIEMDGQEIFINEVLVKECRGIKDFNVVLSEKERKHLIITGKNGSGKTSLLELLNSNLMASRGRLYRFEKEYRKVEEKGSISININNLPKNLFGETVMSSFSEKKRKLIYAYLPAIRKTKFNETNGISDINLQHKLSRKENLSIYFLQYLVNLKASKAFAIADEEHDVAKKVDEWFERFESLLKDIFDNPKLELKFDRKDYSFSFIEEGKDPYSFETLSDGYASVIAIVAELIMRMEVYETEVYDMQGIVLIDEIESHLHVDLQKKILPFLTTFFPKIQFIVTTHSPFVISSMRDAVVCDLEHQIVANDLSTYSYDALLESYFGVDKYSDVLKEKVTEYEVLSSKKDLGIEEKFELKELRAYLDHAPLFLSKELKVKLQQIDLNNLNKA